MKTRTGVTLIELILFIMVFSVCVIGIATAYRQALYFSYKTRAVTIGTSLAEEKMDEALILGYANIANVSVTSFASPFDEYAYQVNAYNVTAANLDSPVAGSSEYKKVDVKVTHSETGSITLSSVLANSKS